MYVLAFCAADFKILWTAEVCKGSLHRTGYNKAVNDSCDMSADISVYLNGTGILLKYITFISWIFLSQLDIRHGYAS